MQQGWIRTIDLQFNRLELYPLSYLLHRNVLYWSSRVDLNHRPTAYKAVARNQLSYARWIQIDCLIYATRRFPVFHPGIKAHL